MQQRTHTTLVGWILAAALLAGIVGVQFLGDAHQPKKSTQIFTYYSPALLRVADLGLNTATASLLWLGVIQNIATQGSMRGLANNIETINALDPKWSYPYAFGVLMIPMMAPEETQDAVMIGKDGIAKNLGDWRIPFYLASTYHLNLKDEPNATRYFAITANTPGVPEGVRVSTLNYGTRTDLRDKTRAIWVAIYNSSKDDVVREQAKNAVDHIDLVALLDQAIALYKKQYGAYPKTLDDLVRAGILPEVPVDPVGLVIGINPASGNLTFTLPKE